MSSEEVLEKLGPRDRRITRHLRAIAEAGTDVEKFAAALQSMRDDGTIGRQHRDAIYKTLAQDAAQAYFAFVTGKPIDLETIVGEDLPELPDLGAS